VIALLIAIVGGLAAWCAVALGVAVVLGRMIVKREEQIGTGEPLDVAASTPTRQPSEDVAQRLGG